MPVVIVVTGSSGFIGGQLVQLLLTRGVEVVGIDRRQPPVDDPAATHLDAELSRPDAAVRSALAGADAVVHLAGCPGVRDRSPDVGSRRRRDNIAAAEVVVALTPSATPLVVTSSSSVYGGSTAGRPCHEDDPLRPLGGYARSKAAVEARCRDRLRGGGHVTVVRPFTVVGPGQRPDMAVARWISQALRGEPLTVYGSLERRRDVTDVRDVVAALAALVVLPPATVNVGTGIARSLGELVAAVHSVFGDSGVTVVEPPVVEPSATRADTRRCHELLGFTPATDLVDAVRAQASLQLTAT